MLDPMHGTQHFLTHHVLLVEGGEEHWWGWVGGGRVEGYVKEWMVRESGKGKREGEWERVERSTGGGGWWESGRVSKRVDGEGEWVRGRVRESGW